MATKQDIDIKKIQMIWDAITNEVDLYSREYLQYFVTIVAIISLIFVSTITGNFNIGLAIFICLVAVILLELLFYKMRIMKDYLGNSVKELLDELDKLK